MFSNIQVVVDHLHRIGDGMRRRILVMRSKDRSAMLALGFMSLASFVGTSLAFLIFSGLVCH
jgi:hypothetical protein